MTEELPPPGRWALGADRQRQAEALLARARARGLRTAWLGPEAGFVSNLSVMENLRLVYDWHGAGDGGFAQALQAALEALHMPSPDWLHARPAGLTDARLARARLLRVALARPDVVVVHPAVLALPGEGAVAGLLAALDGARLLLLAGVRENWPAWPAADGMSGPVKDGYA
jgi:hypothetical protein